MRFSSVVTVLLIFEQLSRVDKDQVLNKYCLNKSYILSGPGPISELGINPRIDIKDEIPTA